jgi:hypothetical protein
MEIERQFTLEDPSPSETEENVVSSVTVGEGWEWGIDGFRKFCPHREILEHWIGSHLIRESLGVCGLMEGAAVVVVVVVGE